MLALLPLAAESASDEGGSGLIEVVPGLMIWTLICFAIAFFVLRRYAFGPIQKAIEARRDRIRAGGGGGGQRPRRGAPRCSSSTAS